MTTQYPRRVQNLVNKLDSYSDGRNITAAQSRELNYVEHKLKQLRKDFHVFVKQRNT